MRRAICFLVGILLLPLALPACVSFSTYQSPRVLDPGETKIGAGVLVTGGEAGVGELAVLARRGIQEGMDVGGKVWGLPPFFGGVYADVRYQLLREPIYVSGALGSSFSHIQVTEGDDRLGTTTVAVYPTVLVGWERFFGGIRWTQLFGSAGDVEETYGLGFPGVMAGAAFGSRVILAPEVNVHFGDEVLVLPGAALHYRF